MSRIWEKIKAFRRKEKMVPGINRGRAFVKKPSSGKPVKGAKAEPSIKITSLRVIRKDGTTEDIING